MLRIFGCENYFSAPVSRLPGVRNLRMINFYRCAEEPENLIRPFALGRKNWMMSGSPRGAHASALFYSLIATAKANGLNPFHYLKTLFENIRSCRTAEDYKALLPFNLAGLN